MKPSKFISAALLAAIMATPLLAAAADDAAGQADNKITPAANDKMVPAETPAQNRANSNSSSAAAVDDATITSNVKKALASDASISAQKVDVQTQDGVVTVTGKVNDQQHTSRIVQVIASVKGVKSVNNQITLGNS